MHKILIDIQIDPPTILHIKGLSFPCGYKGDKNFILKNPTTILEVVSLDSTCKGLLSVMQ